MTSSIIRGNAKRAGMQRTGIGSRTTQRNEQKSISIHEAQQLHVKAPVITKATDSVQNSISSALLYRQRSGSHLERVRGGATTE